MDYFSLFGVIRHPWLDAEELKGRFHALSARVHPDIHATGNATDFEQLNTAYQVLRDPVRRLRYLLEMEAPATLIQRDVVPQSLVALFMETGQTRAALDGFLAKHAQATTTLAQALLASEKNSMIADLRALLTRIDQAHDEITAGLQTLESYTPEDLLDAYRPLAFLSKWSLHLSEALRKVEMPG